MNPRMSVSRVPLIANPIHPVASPNRAFSLYLTVDVEESFNWDKPSGEFGSICDLEGLNLFHERCRKKGVSPIYLITYRILDNSGFINFFRKKHCLEECELGIHLHSWNTPPIGNKEPTFQCALPPDIEHQKLINLAKRFESIFGCKPMIHRAGRYGVDYETFSLLHSLGIKVDLSPSSGFDFTEKGGPSFIGLTNRLFHFTEYPGLLCLPVPSINFTRGPDWFQRYSGVTQKIFKSKPVRLTPEGNDIERMKTIALSLVKQGVNDIVLTVHSTSFSQGANPYTREPDSYLNILDATFEFIDWCLTSTSLKCSTIQQLYSEYHNNTGGLNDGNT